MVLSCVLWPKIWSGRVISTNSNLSFIYQTGQDAQHREILTHEASVPQRELLVCFDAWLFALQFLCCVCFLVTFVTHRERKVCETGNVWYRYELPEPGETKSDQCVGLLRAVLICLDQTCWEPKPKVNGWGLVIFKSRLKKTCLIVVWGSGMTWLWLKNC